MNPLIEKPDESLTTNHTIQNIVDDTLTIAIQEFCDQGFQLTDRISYPKFEAHLMQAARKQTYACAKMENTKLLKLSPVFGEGCEVYRLMHKGAYNHSEACVIALHLLRNNPALKAIRLVYAFNPNITADTLSLKEKT